LQPVRDDGSNKEMRESTRGTRGQQGGAIALLRVVQAVPIDGVRVFLWNKGDSEAKAQLGRSCNPSCGWTVWNDGLVLDVWNGLQPSPGPGSAYLSVSDPDPFENLLELLENLERGGGFVDSAGLITAKTFDA